jgi:hypothetical protein
MSRTAKWLFVLAGLGILAAATPARAGLIPAGVTVSADSGNFRFTYNVLLPSDYKIQSGDYFTIYDFNGLIGGSNQQPAGWTFSSALLGPVPHGVVPTDSSSVPNLTWTYNGPTITGDANLGNFSALSSLSGKIYGDFASRDHEVNNGRSVSNITTTSIPSPNSDTDNVVSHTPEPSSIALLALGVPVMGLWRWRRLRRAS